jgi:dephospho-CoA kinase
VTGTVSSGKSSVCRILQELGAHVVDADAIVHRSLSSNTVIGKQVLSLLGPDSLSNEQFDRAKIAEIVFKNPALLRKLEGILHPAVLNEIAAEYQRINERASAPLFVAEVPLLFESDSQGFFDWILVVSADPAVCQQRFTQKTGYTTDAYSRRASRLLPLDEKIRRADFVIINNGNLADLEKQTRDIYPKLLANKSETTR